MRDLFSTRKAREAGLVVCACMAAGVVLALCKIVLLDWMMR